MTIVSDISELRDKLFVCARDGLDVSNSFEASANNLLYSAQRDDIFGGVFDHLTKPCKSLSLNTTTAEVFILAANYFGLSKYARLALETLSYISRYHKTSAEYFIETTCFTATELDVQQLQTLLTPSQWLALKTCYDLPDSGTVLWTQMRTKIPHEKISMYSELHPKEVPLALDGALQIIRSTIAGPELTSEQSLLSNIQLCHAFYLSATYLNQAEHGLTADELFNHLTNIRLTEFTETLLSLYLTRLRYQWHHETYNKLKVLYSHLQGNPHDDHGSDCIVCAEILIASIEQQTFDSIRRQVSHLSGIVVISGPEYMARQWLQETNNRFQLKYRYFAVPGSHETRAQLIHTNGSTQEYRSLEELLSLAV